MIRLTRCPTRSQPNPGDRTRVQSVTKTNDSTLIEAIASEVVRLMEPRLAKLSTPNVIQPALLSVTNAAAYLGRTKQALQHMIYQKELPVVRYGRRVHLRRLDLDKWIEQNLY